MAYHAAAAIDDAVDATRARLFPVSGWLWARLAVITLLLGGGGFTGQVTNVPQFQFPADPRPGGPGPAVPTLPELPRQPPTGVDPTIGLLALAVVVVILLAILAFWIVGATMQFVFVDALRVEDRSAVRVLRPFLDRLGAGLRLFLFNLALFLLLAVPVAVVALAVVGLFGVGDTTIVGPAVLAVGVVVFLTAAVLVGIVSQLTTQFVVPVMIVTGGTVLGAWRELYPVLRAQLGQTIVYVVVRFLLGLGVGILNAILVGIGLLGLALVLAVVAGGLGLIAAAVGGETAGLLVGGVVGGVAGLVGLLVVVLGVSVLTKTYLRSYELAALEGFDDRFALLPAYDDGAGSNGDTADGSGGDSGPTDDSDDDGPTDGGDDDTGGSTDDGSGGDNGGPTDGGATRDGETTPRNGETDDDSTGGFQFPAERETRATDTTR